MKTAILSLGLLLCGITFAQETQPAAAPAPTPAAPAPTSDELHSRFAAGLAYLQQVDADVREAVQQIVRVNQENAVRSEETQIKADEVILTKVAALDPSLKDFIAGKTKALEERKVALAAQKKLLDQRKK